MAIDISKPETFKKLTLKDLIADAVARKDAEALKWLQEQANEKKERTKEGGEKYSVRKSIVEIRAAYVKKFLNYKTQGAVSKEKARAAKEAKVQKELDDMFAKAFAQL